MFYDCRSTEVSSQQISDIMVSKMPLRSRKQVNYREGPV